jgi:hypothetical protein
MTEQDILDNFPPKQGKWPDCNQVDDNGKWSHRLPIIRALADIKTIVEQQKRIAELEAYNGELVSKEVVNEILKDERIAELEKECDALTDDLIETQNQARDAENNIEDIESVFCDEDGHPLIEPFNGDGLSHWIAKRDIEQQAEGVDDFADFNLVGNELAAAIRYVESLHKQAKQLRAEVKL